MNEKLNSFQTKSTLNVGSGSYNYYSIPALEKKGFVTSHLPFSIRILLENLLRNEDGKAVTVHDVEAVARWQAKKVGEQEINFMPARVILQDFTGVPAVADLAAMRDAVVRLGGQASRINPLIPCELVIDHSVQVDFFGTSDAQARNEKLEFERNGERYKFLRWGQEAFQNFKVVPPATGIVHQVNIENLARVVFENAGTVYPDTLVGTDSHTTMANGLGIVGWGVGGIEAEAAMLGQPITMLIPEVVGVELTGKLQEGVTATDLVLTLTQMLRKIGVVGKFVEFYGDGLKDLPLADRATISNMAPEFGSTIAVFPIDEQTLSYLRLTNRSEDHIELVRAYAKAQGFFWEPGATVPEFTQTMKLDLATVVPCLAGPKRPQDRVALSDAKRSFEASMPSYRTDAAIRKSGELQRDDKLFSIQDGDVVIAAITSCTNTSNPHVLIAAGLLARKARLKGLSVKPWVKTSLAPGSKVVTEYLRDAGVLDDLEALNFHVVGYGCTTCIGNSGPLPEVISEAIGKNDLVAVSVLSGNRNFEGRVNPDVRANYLASPPLVVAYALAGRMTWDPQGEPLGTGFDGAPVYLKDIWPTQDEIQAMMTKSVTRKHFEQQYKSVFSGSSAWQAIETPQGDRYAWKEESTYIRQPSFFDELSKTPSPLKDIIQARVLAVLGDSVTTDHISPAGSIAKQSPAALYLQSHGVVAGDFNSYGARRGNHEVMMRGTFANIRLKNALVGGKEGGLTRLLPDNKEMSIFDASMEYQKRGIPLVIIAGKEYGSGSSRDWAAKGTFMLGVKAVVAESFERIHRSNLIGMGVLPLEFMPGDSALSLKITGEEIFAIEGLSTKLEPRCVLKVKADGRTFDVRCRIDTPVEMDYYQHGGILNFVLRQILEGKSAA